MNFSRQECRLLPPAIAYTWGLKKTTTSKCTDIFDELGVITQHLCVLVRDCSFLYALGMHFCVHWECIPACGRSLLQLWTPTSPCNVCVLVRYTWEALGPEHTGHFVQPHVAVHCGGDIYSRRKPLFSSFGEHTAVCGSSVRQAVARPRHRQSVCIHNIHVAATCRPSVLGSATMVGHMWLNKVASVLGPLMSCNLLLVWDCVGT